MSGLQTLLAKWKGDLEVSDAEEFDRETITQGPMLATCIRELEEALSADTDRLVGFYEEEYPFYADKWTNELQSPVTAEELNGLVDRLRKAEQVSRSQVVAFGIEAVTSPGKLEVLRLYHADERADAGCDVEGWTESSAARVVALVIAGGV